MISKRITIWLINGESHVLVCAWDNRKRQTVVKVEDDILRFGRDDGEGWRELLAAPRTSVLYWN